MAVVRGLTAKGFYVSAPTRFIFYKVSYKNSLPACLTASFAVASSSIKS